MLAILMIFGLCAGSCCAQSEAVTALLNQWTLFMDANESWFAAMEWTLDHADEFCSDRSWDKLVRARIACADSYSALLHIPMPEETLTEEDYLNIFREGIEFSSMTTELEQFQASVYVDIQFLKSVQADLFQGIFTGTDALIIQQRIAACRASIRSMEDYYRYISYYLLLEIGDEAFTETYWASMQERCPHIFSSRDVFELDDLESLSQRIDAILDEYEEVFLLYQQSMGMMEYSIEQMLQMEDLQMFIGDLCAISDLPLLLPYPVWLNCDEALIFHLDYNFETSEISYPASMAELEALPNSIAYCMDNVDEASILAYIETLADCGIAFEVPEDSSSMNLVAPIEGGGYAMLVYEQNSVHLYFLGCQVCFAPEWYIENI